MTALFAERIYGIPWLVLALAAAVIAAIYLFTSGGGGGAAGLHWFVLRWFHSIAWFFLALAALVRAKVSDAPVEWVAPLAAIGGLAYVVFMVTTVAGQGS